MKVPLIKKNEYWLYFIEKWIIFGEGGGHGVTGPRLRKIKNIIFSDNDFWEDVVLRHGGLHKSPEELRLHHLNVFEHCQANFWGMIYQNLVENRIIKIRLK